MTASEQCKTAGLASLKELAEMSKQSNQTLTNWHNNKPELFDLVVMGAVVQKKYTQVLQFVTVNPPRIAVAVTAHNIIIDGIKHSYEEFRENQCDLTPLDRARIFSVMREDFTIDVRRLDL